ncbi:MAG TPA: hypothetical protein VM616_01940 [Gammaproteobacteria bacterium]|nr:hypothetical protein [Gammaproteobacteria bacterium]
MLKLYGFTPPHAHIRGWLDRVADMPGHIPMTGDAQPRRHA